MVTRQFLCSPSNDGDFALNGRHVERESDRSNSPAQEAACEGSEGLLRANRVRKLSDCSARDVDSEFVRQGKGAWAATMRGIGDRSESRTKSTSGTRSAKDDRAGKKESRERCATTRGGEGVRISGRGALMPAGRLGFLIPGFLSGRKFRGCRD